MNDGIGYTAVEIGGENLNASFTDPHFPLGCEPGSGVNTCDKSLPSQTFCSDRGGPLVG
jgi:hypothetical protein